MKKHASHITLLWLILSLMACGGSGGSNDTQNSEEKVKQNQQPNVLISVNATLTLTGQPLQFTATVNDDGLPNNSISIQWAIIDPPAADAVIASPNATATAITFNSMGIYSVEVSADDGEFNSSNTIQITVEKPNEAPVVNAGAEQSITLPVNQVELSGSFTDDNLPGTSTTYLWELIEPADSGVSIEQPDSITTNVTFQKAGTYTFQLTVSDGELAGSATTTVIVEPPIVPDPVIGVFPRPTNTSCIAPNLTQLPPTSITLVKAFPELQDLGKVVALKQAPGNNLNWYAAMPQGKIVEFVNNALTTTYTDFLNIESIVHYQADSELGLLGMAFHPDYQTNGQVFVHYTIEETVKIKKNNELRLRSVISRFTKVNDVWQEDIILKIDQPEIINNGGNLDFDHNGYLLISLGDGGSDNDSLGLAQDNTALLGSILRIDVDNGTPYEIPADNPYVGNNLCNDPATAINANACPEIYAYGFRKPNYFSVDSAINVIWASDSGQNTKAEINLIQPGQNYGWNIMEGSLCRPGGDPNCDQTGLTLPVYDYDFLNADQSVAGGYVYRGTNMNFLYGNYVFADTATGKLYVTKAQGNQYVTEELFDSDLVISGFAQSNSNDLYVLDPTPGVDGKGNNIWKVVPDLTGTEPGQVASNLSETGCVDSVDPTQPSTAMISYEVINPLWTDGAVKQRYFAIPDGSTITMTPDGDLQFPTGSVLMKHFVLNGQYIETRLLMYHPEGWLGYSYEWQYDADGNPVDAVLLDGAKTKPIGNQTWIYPSRQDCLECHTADLGRAIGPETLQLNRSHTFPENDVYTDNQLLSFNQIGLLTTPLDQALLDSKLVSLNDESAPVDQKAKSYLHSNCSFCHHPTSPNSSELDFRYRTPLADMNACNVTALLGDTGLFIIDPTGNYDFPNSVLPLRMESTLDSGFRMPPLGSDVIDTSAVDIIKRWIDGLQSCN